MIAAQSKLIDTFSQCFKAPYSGSIKDWCEENINVQGSYSVTGKLNLSTSAYMIFPLQVLGYAKQVNLIGASQIIKTFLIDIYIQYLIANDGAGDILRLFATEAQATSNTQNRLIPSIKACKAIAPLFTAKNSLSKNEIIAPHMRIRIDGPSDSVTSSDGYRRVYIDEFWQFEKADILPKAKGRMTQFEKTSQLVISSNPSKAGDALSEEQQKGHIYEYGFRCPKCKTVQKFEWSRKKPDHTEENKSYAGMNKTDVYNPDGKTLNIAATALTTKLHCFFCPHSISDTPPEREELNTPDTWIQTKFTDDPTVVTLRVSAMASKRISFAILMKEYLEAKKWKKDTGNSDKLKTFWNQRLGKEFGPDVEREEFNLLTNEYDPQGDIPDLAYKALAVDVQENKKYWILRAITKDGGSRLLKIGIAITFEDINQIAVENKVQPHNVFIDCNYNADTVYLNSIVHGTMKEVRGIKRHIGWTCTRGSGRDDFKNGSYGSIYYTEGWQECKSNDVRVKGKKAKVVTFSNLRIKKMLFYFMAGKGKPFETYIANPELKEIYDKHLASEVLEKVKDKATGLMKERFVEKSTENHFLDCEVLLILSAYRRGMLGNINAA